MKILAICGSPRKNGNTAFLLKKIVELLKAKDINAELLMLSDYKIEMCNGCLVCEDTDCTGDCSINDDMTNIIFTKLLESEAIIFGTPSYFDMPTGLMKNFMDRSNAILNRIIEKKLPFGIIVVGQSNFSSLDATCDAVQRYCSICGMEEVSSSPVRIIARDVGDAEKNNDAVKLLDQLADSFARKVK